MEYTCVEGMGALPFLMEEKDRSAMNMHSASSCFSGSNQLLESFHAQQQQQLNSNYYFNPPIHFNFPAVSWSTTDPTLLLSDPEPQREEELFSIGNSVNVSSDSKRDDDMGIEGSCCGLSSFPTALEEPHHSRRSSNLGHRHGGVVDNSNAATVEGMNLNVDTTMTDAGGGSIHRGNALSSGSRSRSIDPFSFCGGGGRGIGSAGNASSQSQWIPQMCSLPSDQYYSCGDAFMMPKLVSDPFSDSPRQQQQLQQQPIATYYTSSTSVNCLHEADSCGSSDRDLSTTSEEINWMNNNSSCTNNSDIISTLPNLHRGCGDSVTGLMSSSPSVVPVEIVPDEDSSPIAATANDDGDLAAVTTATLDHVRFSHHHHRSTCGSSTIECGAAAASAPSGRVSWMSPGIGSCQNQLLELQQMNNGLVPMLPRSLLGPFKPNQQRSQTFDNNIQSVHSSVQRGVPFSSSQQNYSSNNGTIYPRYNSSVIQAIMPPLINPGVVNNCTTSSNSSFCRDFHSFSSRLPQQQQQGEMRGEMAATASSVQAGGGFESRRDYGSDHGTVLSATRKPNATSIEPQSVAARFRRKKISERVKVLEKLIPGVDKMDTASMLDEAIEYVKFLQLQVQLLESMGEPELVNNGSTTAPATTGTTTTTGNNNSSAFYSKNSNNPCKVDSSSSVGGGFGSSSHLSRSASFMQQVTIAAAATATTKASSSPPLILSEVLQEQLFKQKLCLVSLRQFPQQQPR